MFSIYDSLTKKIQTLSQKSINLYSCGPTVYDKAHIGNLRSFIFADTIRQTLLANGAKVKWVMNITDVDDKTIKKTLQKFGTSSTVVDLKKLTDEYTEGFLSDLEKLNIDTKSIHIIKVSEVISQIQEMILKLITLGFAYTSEDGSVYFSISAYQERFKDYGALVGEDFMEGKKVSARVRNDEYEKDNLSDFALWKSHDDEDGQIFWTHPKLANGRPGWHIECSTINEIGFSGEATDIHTGGIDLLFPHHTNEIAQSKPLYNPFVKLWAHNTHLLVDGKKMSKSLGNLYTLQDIEDKNINPLALKYLFLNSHFTGQVNFTWQSLEASNNALLSLYKKPYNENLNILSELEDDLSTPKALARLHTEGINEKSLSALGLPKSMTQSIAIPDEIKKLVEERSKAKLEKNFTLADEIRKQVDLKGYKINDTKDGIEITKC